MRLSNYTTELGHLFRSRNPVEKLAVYTLAASGAGILAYTLTNLSGIDTPSADLIMKYSSNIVHSGQALFLGLALLSDELND